MLKTILIFSIYNFLVYSIPWSKSADSGVINDVIFYKLGTYRGFTDEGSEYQKSYFFTRYSLGTWSDARSFCSSYDLEFITLETLDEARAFLTMADNNSFLRSRSTYWIYIDAVTHTIKSRTDWYWTNSGKKISYAMPWRLAAPNNDYNDEYCLSFGKGSLNENFGFDDVMCNSGTPFACQRIELLIP
ncbi:hypothetical protein ACKWTF_008858 [Chironomus riparius]